MPVPWALSLHLSLRGFLCLCPSDTVPSLSWSFSESFPLDLELSKDRLSP